MRTYVPAPPGYYVIDMHSFTERTTEMSEMTLYPVVAFRICESAEDNLPPGERIECPDVEPVCLGYEVDTRMNEAVLTPNGTVIMVGGDEHNTYLPAKDWLWFFKAQYFSGCKGKPGLLLK